MSESMPSSKVLLKGVLLPHLKLAEDLMGMVKTFDTSDPTHRYQIASIIIFLAGVDKTLSLAFELLYLTGKVEWNWMVPNKKYKPPAGFIECQRGTISKINKLMELGIDVTYIQEIIDLRNEYIHSSQIYVGYTEGIDEIDSKIQLIPSGPVISFLLSPIMAFQLNEIHYCAEQLVEEIGSFIDKTDWRKEWCLISQKAKELPQNPEPEYSQFLNEPERGFEVLETLNIRFVGDGAELLRR